MIFKPTDFELAWAIHKMPVNSMQEHNAAAALNQIIHDAVKALNANITPNAPPPYATVFQSAYKLRAYLPGDGSVYQLDTSARGVSFTAAFKEWGKEDRDLAVKSAVMGFADKAPLLITLSSMLAINHVCAARR